MLHLLVVWLTCLIIAIRIANCFILCVWKTSVSSAYNGKRNPTCPFLCIKVWLMDFDQCFRDGNSPFNVSLHIPLLFGFTCVFIANVACTNLSLF